MPFNVKEILDGSAALLNDVGLTNFTYTAQIPYFKIAYEDLRQELMDSNIPISNKTSASVVITTTMNDIGGDTGPALPIDLIEVIALWERTNGTTNDFLWMKPVRFLPKSQTLTSFLGTYAWRDQVIELLGANGPVEVKIDYIGDPLSNIVDENSQIRVLNSSNCLKYRTAALAAEFIGENPERAESLNANASHALDSLLGIAIKAQQNMPVRRRPFRRR